jgi:signal transduction histidine kinase
MARLSLFRIAQEALQNATKHSGARSIRIVLAGTPRELSLSVSDDGNGMAPRNDQVSGGLGITGMRERLILVGGSLSIKGIPGEGSRVSAHIPLPLTPQFGSEFR